MSVFSDDLVVPALFTLMIFLPTRPSILLLVLELCENKNFY